MRPRADFAMPCPGFFPLLFLSYSLFSFSLGRETVLILHSARRNFPSVSVLEMEASARMGEVKAATQAMAMGTAEWGGYSLSLSSSMTCLVQGLKDGIDL